MKKILQYKEFTKNVLNRYPSVSEEAVSAANVQHLNQGKTLLPAGKISRQIHILYHSAIVSCYLDKVGDVFIKISF